MSAIFTTKDQITASTRIVPIYVIRSGEWELFNETLSASQQTYSGAQNFKAKAGQSVLLPASDGEISGVLFGAGALEKDEQGPIRAGGLSGSLRQVIIDLNVCLKIGNPPWPRLAGA